MKTIIRKIILVMIIITLTTSYTYASGVNFNIKSKSALLMESDSGEILYEKNSDKPYKIASLTKIMTAYLTLEAIENKEITLNDIVEVTKEGSLIGGSSLYMTEGVNISVEDLLESMMILSANDSAYMIATHISGSELEFVKRMNNKAKELGMKTAKFNNSHGLPTEDDEEENIMSSYDMGLLVKDLFKKYEKEIIDITKRTYYANEDLEVVRLSSNKLLNKYDGVDGLKTGYTTKARFCLVSTLNVKKETPGEEDFRLISISLGAPTAYDRDEEHINLLNYGSNNFIKTNIFRAYEEIESINLYNNEKYKVKLIPGKDIDIITDEYIEIDKIENSKDKNVKLPIKRGQVLGNSKIYLSNGETINIDLISDRSVDTKGFVIVLNKIFSKLTKLFD